jgi:Zn-dependent oligopeptidase
VSLAKKMASLEGANALLDDLKSKSFDKAAAEHAELEAFAVRVRVSLVRVRVS